ncbi:unnamed protein product [Diplocarpon coronariae]
MARYGVPPVPAMQDRAVSRRDPSASRPPCLTALASRMAEFVGAVGLWRETSKPSPLVPLHGGITSPHNPHYHIHITTSPHHRITTLPHHHSTPPPLHPSTPQRHNNLTSSQHRRSHACAAASHHSWAIVARASRRPRRDSNRSTRSIAPSLHRSIAPSLHHIPHAPAPSRRPTWPPPRDLLRTILRTGRESSQTGRELFCDRGAKLCRVSADEGPASRGGEMASWPSCCTRQKCMSAHEASVHIFDSAVALAAPGCEGGRPGRIRRMPVVLAARLTSAAFCPSFLGRRPSPPPLTHPTSTAVHHEPATIHSS